MTHRDIREELSSVLYRARSDGLGIEALYALTDHFEQSAWTISNFKRLATSWSQSCDFAYFRLLELTGKKKIAHDDVYVLAMIGALGHRSYRGIREFFLTHDSGLCELWWRVFEVEGGGEVSLANVDKFSRPEAGWSATVLSLVDLGVLPRDRVLRSCLQALNRDFSAYRAGWFSKMYAALDPTVDEIEADQRRLIDILPSTVAASLALAVTKLAVLGRAGRLDALPFTVASRSALAGASKSTARKILRILAVAARGETVPTEILEATLTAGLHNAHPEIQHTAVTMLLTVDAAHQVRDNWLDLSPSVQNEFAALGPAVATGTTMTTTHFETTPSEAVHPWLRNEVVERTAALLEDPTDALEMELALQAWVSLPDPSVLSPLSRRAGRVKTDAPVPQRAVAAAVLAASGRPSAARFDQWPKEFYPRVGHYPPLIWEQFREVVAILAGRLPQTALLATPTDAGGWLNPEEFARRLTSATGPLLHHDVVAALLRVAPDGREPALAELTGLSGLTGQRGELVEAATYALGGPAGSVRNRAWWVAASFCRAPFDDDPLLLGSGLTLPGQGMAGAVEVRVEKRPEPNNFALSVVSAGRIPWIADQPTVFPDVGIRQADLANGLARLGVDYPVLMKARALQIPADAELFSAVALEEMISDIDEIYISPAPTVALATLARHAGRFGPVSAAVLALGMSSKSPGHRSQAAETFSEVSPGRLSSPTVAAAMAQLRVFCTPGRWAATLTDAAQLNPIAVLDTLTALIPELPHADRAHGALLPVLYEETLRAGRRVDNPALRSHLHHFSGPSKTAKTAKNLLALD